MMGTSRELQLDALMIQEGAFKVSNPDIVVITNPEDQTIRIVILKDLDLELQQISHHLQ